ncbi:ABC transporter substrate-binding protein [Modestobacter sp. URMC 112]
MSRSRIGIAISVGAILVLAACGGDGGTTAANADCTPEHEFETVTEGTLTVGLVDLPPYAMTTGEDGMSGVDADIVKEFAERECLTVTPQPGDAAALIPSVQQGRMDLAIADWYRTAAREEVVNLSDPLYLDDMGILSEDGISEISELEGRKVGTVDGYLWVQDLQEVLGDDLVLYPSSVNLNQDLASGRVQVGVDSYGSALQTQKDTGLKVEVAKPDPRVAASEEPAQAGIPVSPDNEELLEALNAVLADLHESGRIAEILESYGLPASAADVGEPRLIS